MRSQYLSSLRFQRPVALPANPILGPVSLGVNPLKEAFRTTRWERPGAARAAAVYATPSIGCQHPAGRDARAFVPMAFMGFQEGLSRTVAGGYLVGRMDATNEMGPVLLRVTEDAGKVRISSSSGETGVPDLSGIEVHEISRRLPQNGRYALMQLALPDRVVTTAARLQGEEVFFYYMTGDGSRAISSIPAFRLSRESGLPLATPGAVALLGYTPWEIAGSDFLRVFGSGQPVGMASVLDRWGRRHELVYQSTRDAEGSVWITVSPLPPEISEEPGRETVDWDARPVSTSRSELDSALAALGLPGGAFLERSGDRYVILAIQGMQLSDDDISPDGFISRSGPDASEWVDIEEGDPEGHLFLKSFGRSGRYLGVFKGALNPLVLERRARFVLPLVAARLDLAAATRSGIELETRKALLESIEKIMTDRGVSSWNDLPGVIDDLAREIGATLLAVLAPSGEPLAQKTGSRTDDAREAHPSSFETRLRGGRVLRAAFDRPDFTDQAILRALARMLERFCHRDAPQAQREAVLSTLRALYMESFRVIWQGEGMELSSCFEFFGRSSPCEGCPVSSGSASERGRPVVRVQDGWVEEIVPTGRGHSLHWMRQLQDNPDQGAFEKLPGGAAVYDAQGAILSWSSWFEATSGVEAKTAVGQGAARLVEKVGGPRILRQLELAEEGVFLPESVEVVIGGRRCLSKISPGTRKGLLYHFLLDARSAGFEDAALLAGPGASGAEGDPASLMATLSAVCEVFGWSLLTSVEATASATRVWLSSPALTEFLLELLRLLAQIVPEKKMHLAIRSVSEIRGLSGRPVLPAAHCVMTFDCYPVLLSSHVSAMAALDREMISLGGWVARGAEGEEVSIAFPRVVEREEGPASLLLYSADQWFAEEARAVLGQVSIGWRQAETLEELVDLQQGCSAIMIRLKPGEMNLGAALAARCPGQSIILATGLRPRIPLTAGSILHLPLPASRDEILAAVRRMVVL